MINAVNFVNSIVTNDATSKDKVFLKDGINKQEAQTIVNALKSQGADEKDVASVQNELNKRLAGDNVDTHVSLSAQSARFNPDTMKFDMSSKFAKKEYGLQVSQRASTNGTELNSAFIVGNGVTKEEGNIFDKGSKITPEEYGKHVTIKSESATDVSKLAGDLQTKGKVVNVVKTDPDRAGFKAEGTVSLLAPMNKTQQQTLSLKGISTQSTDNVIRLTVPPGIQIVNDKDPNISKISKKPDGSTYIEVKGTQEKDGIDLKLDFSKSALKPNQSFNVKIDNSTVPSVKLGKTESEFKKDPKLVGQFGLSGFSKYEASEFYKKPDLVATFGGKDKQGYEKFAQKRDNNDDVIVAYSGHEAASKPQKFSVTALSDDIERFKGGKIPVANTDRFKTGAGEKDRKIPCPTNK